MKIINNVGGTNFQYFVSNLQSIMKCDHLPEYIIIIIMNIQLIVIIIIIYTEIPNNTKIIIIINHYQLL